MSRIAPLMILSLAACGRSPVDDSPEARQAWVDEELALMFRRAADEPDAECIRRVSSHFDRFLGQVLSVYSPPPVEEIRHTLARHATTPPFVLLLDWRSIPGSRDLLIPYTIALSATSGSSQLRIVRYSGDGCCLVRPARPDLRAVGRELGYWRGGDLHMRYGPPYHPSEVRLEECSSFYPPRIVSAEPDGVSFALDYGISSTCPSNWDILWRYEAGALTPIGYSWGCGSEQPWRAFGLLGRAALADEVVRRSPWEEK